MAHDVPPAELLEAEVVRAWASRAVAALDGAREALDGANVFPVPDGDTGTNMYLTLREGAHAVRAEPAGVDGACLLRLLARGALLGARGNSGVILSEWLRGLAAAATRRQTLAAGLDAAARTARRAVARPAPGTILTAADAAAAAALEAAAAPVAGSLPGAAHRQGVLEAARRGAREATLTSTESLAALRDAGVLDSGAGGLVLVLQALGVAHHEVASSGTASPGGMSEAPGTMSAVTLDIDLRGPGAGRAARASTGGAPGAGPGAEDELELMFVLHRPAGAVDYSPGAVAAALRRDLAAVGGSVVVVGGASGDDAGGGDGPADGDTLWQAHVHTADLAAALAVPRRWAARARVSHLYVRHLAAHDATAAPWGVVAATTSPGLAGELARGGAVVLVGLDAPVTAEDLAVAAQGDARRRVLVLPGDVPGGRPAVAAAIAALRADEPAPGSGEPSVVVLDAPTDAHLVVALGLLAESAGATTGTDVGAAGGDVPAAVSATLGALRVERRPADGAPAALTTLLDVAAQGGRAEVVTVLADQDVDTAVTGALVRAAEEAGADVLVLSTGRPGDGVELALESPVPHAAEGATEGGPEVEG